ncbi:(Fe-S)-binding protein [Phascolarctobacterium succinatutens]
MLPGSDCRACGYSRC